MFFGPQELSGLELIYEEVDKLQSESRDPTIRGKKWFLFAPSYRPVRRQHFLKAASRAARAKVVPAQLFAEFLGSMNDSQTAFHIRFGREPLAALAGEFEIGVFMIMSVVWHMASWFEGCG
jgi:hypothetical protein